MRFSNSLAVAFGGVCGAGVRWVLQTKFSLSSDTEVPWMVLIINITGCCFLGILLGKKVNKEFTCFLESDFVAG